MSTRITVTVESELDDQWARARTVLGRGIRDAVEHAVVEGAEEAVRVHQYKDRSGDLTKSIRGQLTAANTMGADGVIEAREKYASFVENGTRAHEIRPKLGKTEQGPLAPSQSRSGRKVGRAFLRWEDDGGAVHFARVVHHPGSKSLPFMGPAHLKAERVLERDIRVAEAKAAEELT